MTQETKVEDDVTKKWVFKALLSFLLKLKSVQNFKVDGIRVYQIPGHAFVQSLFLIMVNESLKQLYLRALPDNPLKYLSGFTNTMFEPNRELGEERETWLVVERGVVVGCFAFRFFNGPHGKVAYINAQMTQSQTFQITEQVMRTLLSVHPDVKFLFGDSADIAAMSAVYDKVSFNARLCVPTMQNTHLTLIGTVKWLLEEVVDPWLLKRKKWVDFTSLVNYQEPGPKIPNVNPFQTMPPLLQAAGFTPAMINAGHTVVYGIMVTSNHRR